MPFVTAIIPVFNEEEAIAGVVAGVQAHVDRVIVVDGQSTDQTRVLAEAAGATVVVEMRRGYGRAMQTGVASLPPETDIILFIDGDGSDRTEMIPAVLAPIIDGSADFSHGTRLAGECEPGSVSLPQRVAGSLAGWLIRMRYGARFTDMSPFRALRFGTLSTLGMRDETYGWNLEMQMRVAARGLRIVEVSVGQRRRVGGVSKVSGDLWTALRVTFILASRFFEIAIRLK